MAETVHAPTDALGARDKDLPPQVSAQLLEPVRKLLDTSDIRTIAKFLSTYTGDVSVVMQHLQATRGNAFCEALAAEQKQQGEPSAWDRLVKDGKLHFESKKDASQAEQQPAGEDHQPAPAINNGQPDGQLGTARSVLQQYVGDKEISRSTQISKQATYLDHTKQAQHALGQAGIQNKVGEAEARGQATATANATEGVKLASTGDASAKLLGTTVAISSKPFVHELFGEAVTAQFTLGMSATAYAEAKGEVGLDVGWTGFGARANLTGAGTGNADLTGAATLSWDKKSPEVYAQNLAGNNAWRKILGQYVPAWMLRALPDSKVQSWLQSLIELVISSGGGNQVLLGASTSATARGALGLPALSFAGGALAVRKGAGLSFGGANAGFDVEMGKDAGMELLTMLAFGGGTALLHELAPNLSISKFLDKKIDAGLAEHDNDEEAGKGSAFIDKMSALRDKAKSLDGNHSYAWNKGQQKTAGDVTAQGHDVTYTRDKNNSRMHTGDAARDEQATYEQGQAATTEPAKGGKLREITQRVMSDTRVTVASTSHRYSKTAVEKKTELDIAGAHGDASGRALEVEASAKGQATLGAAGLSIGGNASASVVLIGGQAKIATPDLPFTVLGEQLTGKVGLSMDAGAFAEASGNASLDVGWGSTGLEANVSGFAGVKAGITAAASLTWSRKPTSHYVDQIVQTGAWKALFGTMLPQWVLNRAPDKYVRNWISSLIDLLVHGNGDALVLGAVARGEASAGIGAAASFAAKFQGGVLHCHGRGGITFGLGAGATADVSLGVTDGMAMLGLMTLRGGTELFNVLQPQMQMMTYLKPLFSQMRNRESLEPTKNAAG